MEYIDGIELLDMLSQEKIYSESQARRLFDQILVALEYLHKNNIVHRDIKPSNLLVSNGDQTLYIVDFNVSREFDKNKQIMKTNTGIVQFSAPEMFTKQPYTEKIDIWSAGIILYMMLSGTQPFIHDNLQKLALMIQ